MFENHCSRAKLWPSLSTYHLIQYSCFSFFLYHHWSSRGTTLPPPYYYTVVIPGLITCQMLLQVL